MGRGVQKNWRIVWRRNLELLVKDIKGKGGREGLPVVLVRHTLECCKANDYCL